MNSRNALVVAALCLLILGCESSGKRTGSSPTPPAVTAAAPHLFDNLGNYSRNVTTLDPQAKRYFDQGLIWMYSFNHAEAIRSFEYAAKLDPSFAMAHWGVAICLGPHINAPMMDVESSQAAWKSLQLAKANMARCTPVERSLITALEARYVNTDSTPPEKIPTDPQARAALDRAYADAMKAAYAKHPDDLDVATIYAESLMDLRPWDLYSTTGEERPETPEIVRVLEKVLTADPRHPGANHLYVHAVEASNTPERANAAADRLRTLVPGSGHMVHMPSHIDVRTGRWNLAAQQNTDAIGVHQSYAKISPRQGLYRAYMFHNVHFLSYACMMAGREADAIEAARAMVRSIPEEFYRDFAPVADAYLAIEVESLMRFGRWDEILKEPEPREELPITRTFWRFARAIAHAAKGDVAAARAEQKQFREYRSRVPQDAMMAINPAHTVLEIAEKMLEGEILYREKDVEGAVKHLKEAIAIEDSLQYIEPPDWVQPVRHALGAFLMESGRAAEAEEVYRQDLKKWAENGWALYGLAQALRANGKTDEAAEVEKRFEKAWDRADFKLTSSCQCAPGEKGSPVSHSR